MKAFKWNYKALAPMDIFLSYCNLNPLTAIIRINDEGIGHVFDPTVPGHAGLVYPNRSEFMSAEETARGFITQSLEKYCTNHNQIIYIWRCDLFINKSILDVSLNKLAWLMRKNLDYGWATLFTFPKFLRWLRPIFKIDSDDDTEVCSENVFKRLVEAGLRPASTDYPQGYPVDWNKNTPSPNDLHHFFMSHPQMFHLVTGWKA
jgi:hypothetical protein